LSCGEPVEEVGTDSLGSTDGSIQPGLATEIDLPACELHPALGQPVNQVSAAVAQPGAHEGPLRFVAESDSTEFDGVAAEP